MARTHTTPRRLGAALLGALLPLAVLVGCTEDDPEPKFESPSAEPSSEPTESEPTEPVEPTPPAAMNGNDEAGAKAFVEYYFELLDYAALTGDTKKLDSVAIETCLACKGYSQSVRDVYRSGGRASGGQATLSGLKVNSRGVLGQGVRPFDALMTMQVSSLRVSGTGDPELDGRQPAFKGKVQAQISHGRTGWLMSEWTQL